MKILRVHGENFMSLDKFDVEFADGLTVVTGPNGAGKSSLTEAVAATIYGETTRGTPFWRRGEECRVNCDTSDFLARRSVSKSGKKSLEWTSTGRSYGTTSKAQEDLLRHVPPFEVWRRTSVFSSSDASLFSTARDSQRKELLEHLLGIDRFDAALEQCRRDLKASTSRELELRSKLDRLAAVLAEKRDRLADARSTFPELDATAEWFALWSLEQQKKLADEAESEVGARLNEIREDRVRHEAELAHATKKMKLLELGSCPTCERELGEELEASIKEHLDVEEKKWTDACRKREAEADKLYGRRRAISSMATLLSGEVARLRACLGSERESTRARERAAAAIREVEAGLEKVEADLRSVEDEHGEAEERAATLSAVEYVLGLRGVRSRVLGGALAGLEALANSRLGRMFPGASLKMSPYTERKNGSVADSISMQILGVGDDLGYAANSGGQRRRVDVSLLLGLADMADAAASRSPGTIFFDEAFDALDADGIDKVSEIVAEMAESRPVVVISHNLDLVENLLPLAEQRLVASCSGHPLRGKIATAGRTHVRSRSRRSAEVEGSVQEARGEVRSPEASPPVPHDGDARVGSGERPSRRTGGSPEGRIRRPRVASRTSSERQG